MALVTVQRSPSPSDTSERSDEEDGLSPARQRSFSESYFAKKGTALVLAQTECPRRITTRFSQSDGISSHLQSMFYLLRPHDTIKVAVKLEAMDSCRHRYMVVVSCITNELTDECVILGIDCNETVTIGLVLPIYPDTRIELNGDGGFQVMSHGYKHLFKPISVQAMWSVLQSVYKVASNTANNKYHPNSQSQSSINYYTSRIKSDRSCIIEWFSMGESGGVFTDTVTANPDDPSVDLQKVITTKLREIMFTVDLEEVTGKFLRTSLESCLNRDLSEFKSFVDRQTLMIFGQMDASSCILPNLYLGSEWNASNLEELKANNVRNILNISREIDNFFPGMFKYMNVREWDVEETDLLKYWDKTSTFMHKARQAGHSVLVHCKMGVSRSAATVIAFVMKEKGWGLDETIRYVRSRRSCIKPLPSFIKQLEIYEGIINASRQRYNSLFKSKSENNLQERDMNIEERGMSDREGSYTPTVPRRKSWASQECMLDDRMDEGFDASCESSDSMSSDEAIPVFSLQPSSDVEDGFEETQTKSGDIEFVDTQQITVPSHDVTITLDKPGESNTEESQQTDSVINPQSCTTWYDTEFDIAGSLHSQNMSTPSKSAFTPVMSSSIVSSTPSTRLYQPVIVDRLSLNSPNHFRPDNSWIQADSVGVKTEADECDTVPNGSDDKTMNRADDRHFAPVINLQILQGDTKDVTADSSNGDNNEFTPIDTHSSNQTAELSGNNSNSVPDISVPKVTPLSCKFTASNNHDNCDSESILVHGGTNKRQSNDNNNQHLQHESNQVSKSANILLTSDSDIVFCSPPKLELKPKNVSTKLCDIPFGRLLSEEYSPTNDNDMIGQQECETNITEPMVATVNQVSADIDLDNKTLALNGNLRLRPDDSWIVDEPVTQHINSLSTNDNKDNIDDNRSHNDIYLNDFDIEPCDTLDRKNNQSGNVRFGAVDNATGSLVNNATGSPVDKATGSPEDATRSPDNNTGSPDDSTGLPVVSNNVDMVNQQVNESIDDKSKHGKIFHSSHIDCCVSNGEDINFSLDPDASIPSRDTIIHKLQDNKIELGVRVHYVKEAIPWNLGTVKKQAEEMEESIKRTSCDFSDLFATDNFLNDLRPVQRSASLKAPRRGHARNSERRKTCTPLLSPDTEPTNKKLPVAVYCFGDEEVPLKVGLVKKHAKDFENLQSEKSKPDESCDGQLNTESMDMPTDTETTPDFIQEDSVNISDLVDETFIETTPTNTGAKVDIEESVRAAERLDNSDEYIPENIVPNIVQSIEKRQSLSIPVSPTATNSNIDNQFNSKNSDNKTESETTAFGFGDKTGIGTKPIDLQEDMSQDSLDDSLKLSDLSSETLSSSLNKETLYLIREIGSALHEPIEKDDIPDTETLSNVKRITRQIESRSLPRKASLSDRLPVDSPQKRFCQRSSDGLFTIKPTEISYNAGQERVSAADFIKNSSGNMQIISHPHSSGVENMDTSTDVHSSAQRHDLNLDLNSEYCLKPKRTSPHEENQVDGLEFIGDHLVQTLVGKFELGQFDPKTYDEIDSPLSSTFCFSYNDLSAVSELDENTFSDRESFERTPLSREALNSVITKYGTPQHGIFYHFNKIGGHLQGRKIRQLHGKTHPLSKLWPHSTM